MLTELEDSVCCLWRFKGTATGLVRFGRGLLEDDGGGEFPFPAEGYRRLRTGLDSPRSTLKNGSISSSSFLKNFNWIKSK